MPRYLIRASYSHQGIADLIKSPENRADAVRPTIEGLGGTLVSFDYVLGEDDLVIIVELPDNASVAAFSMAISASGAIGSVKTSALMSAEEAIDAMNRAGRVGYRPPGG